MGLKIKIPTNSDGSINVEEFKRVIQNAKQDFAEKSEILSANEHGFVANALKLQLDENSYLFQFCELDKVIKNLNKENNLDRKQK